MLLQGLGERQTQRWLARELFVSPEAVHFWVTGKSRPRPDRLGHIAAILNLEPCPLAFLAGYTDDPSSLEKLLSAYNRWCNVCRERPKLIGLVDAETLCKNLVACLRDLLQDEVVKEVVVERNPELVALVDSLNA